MKATLANEFERKKNVRTYAGLYRPVFKSLVDGSAEPILAPFNFFEPTWYADIYVDSLVESLYTVEMDGGKVVKADDEIWTIQTCRADGLFIGLG